MDFKIDTKEKFYVITPEIKALTANMAEELYAKAISLSQTSPFSIILKMSNVQSIEETAAFKLADCRREIYNNNHSFVACELNDNVLAQIAALELEEEINITPTESEAWDIVQMDEIEREFMADGE